MNGEPPVAHQDPLAHLIRRWGTLAAAVLALKAILSYGLVSFAPLGLQEIRESNLFGRLAYSIPAPASVQADLAHYFAGSTILANQWMRGGLYLVGTLALLTCFVVVIRAVVQSTDLTTESTNLLFRFALLFVAVSVLTYPVFTTDFWLSVAWGRMIVAGTNPYYTDMTRESLQGLPIANWGDRMTYGPLWAYLSAFLAWMAGRQAWLAFFLFKGLLAGAWIGTLVMLRRMSALVTRHDEAVVICLFGWMPMSAGFSVAEGHNDIIMVTPLVLWLFLLAHRRYGWASPSLIASALIKYISAPLLAVDLLAQRMMGRVSWRRYLVSLIPALMLGAAAFLPFARDNHFLDPASQMRNWVFWTPGAAVIEFMEEMGIGIAGRFVNAFILLTCACFVGYYLYRFIRTRDFQHFLGLTLAIVLTMLFAGVGHVWPWFVIWALPLAALNWRSPLAWFVLILAALTPFLNLHWLVGTNWRLRPVSGLFYYFLAALLTLWLFVHYRLRPRLATDAQGSGAAQAGSQ